MSQEAREQARHISEVTKAYAEGKAIQVSHKDGDYWEDTHSPQWQWTLFDYRVKPEERKPITLDLWIMPSTPDVYYDKSFFHDRKRMEEKGWLLKRFVEVLPENETE